MELFLKMI